jgi:hypothetical protein
MGHVDNKTSIPIGGNTPASQLDIQGSVGRGGRNQRPDVEKIQRALNRVPRTQGGPLPPLGVDGLVGPKTIGAIYGFQKHHFGLGGADLTASGARVNAFAFVGGFHKPSTKMSGGSPSLPVRGIYMCTANITTKPPVRMADLIVHEMAHFVGSDAGSPGSIHHAAGGGEAALLAPHRDQIVTAANYAWLAWLARLPKSRWMTDRG